MTYESEIAALERALNSGHRTVQFDGRRVEYQSPADIRSRLKELRQQAAGGRTYRALTQHSTTTRGW